MIKDTKKAIKGQDKFFRHIEKTDEKTCFNQEELEKQYEDSKNKYRELKEKFREEDHNLKEQHEVIQIFKERTRRIKDYITEKKRLGKISILLDFWDMNSWKNISYFYDIESETGYKQTVTEQDIIDSEANIPKLEEKKLEIFEKLKERSSYQDELIKIAKKQLKQMKKLAKDTETDIRYDFLTILKYIGQSEQSSTSKLLI